MHPSAFRGLVSAAGLAALLAAPAFSVAQDPDPPQTATADAPSSGSGENTAGAGECAPPLRGSGYLIVDPRDSHEKVRQRLRKFVHEVRSSVPPELGREETRRQVDAFLESDLMSDGDLPHLAMEFPPGVTHHNVITHLENTPSARESRHICPLSCPVEAMFKNGFHIHLTRPAGGPGDSVLALELYGGPDEGTSSHPHAAGYPPRESLLDRYPLSDDGRVPIGQAFGVRIYLGEPVIPESSQLPPD
jgi:hypothetical protein